MTCACNITIVLLRGIESMYNVLYMNYYFGTVTENLRGTDKASIDQLSVG